MDEKWFELTERNDKLHECHSDYGTEKNRIYPQWPAHLSEDLQRSRQDCSDDYQRAVRRLWCLPARAHKIRKRTWLHTVSGFPCRSYRMACRAKDTADAGLWSPGIFLSYEPASERSGKNPYRFLYARPCLLYQSIQQGIYHWRFQEFSARFSSGNTHD